MSAWSSFKRWLAADPPEEDLGLLYEASGDEGPALDALRGVVDPEVGRDIVSMGLIRGLVVQEGRCIVRMTLTTAGCPMAEHILRAAEEALRAIGLDPTIDLEFEPPWRPGHMRSEGYDV